MTNAEDSDFDLRFTSSIPTISEMEDTMLAEIQNRLKTVIEPPVVDLSNGKVDNRDVWALSILLQEPEYSGITELLLNQNELGDEALVKLSAALPCLKNIQVLDLSDNKLTQNGIYNLLIGLTKNSKSLRVLSLEDNTGIEGNGVRYIGEILETCTSLVSVNLCSIPLHTNIDAFLNGVKASSSLETLILENTYLDAEFMEMFISALCEKDCKCRLRELNLSFNQCKSFSVYTPLFKHHKFSSLSKLHLSHFNKNNNTSYRNSPVQLIYRNMKQNKSIEELYLVGNDIRNKDCKTLQLLLGLPTKLRLLDLSDNNIEKGGAIVLLTGVRNNCNLQTLRLEGNRFLQTPAGEALYEEMKTSLLFNQRSNIKGSYFTAKKSKEGKARSEGKATDGSNSRKQSKFNHLKHDTGKRSGDISLGNLKSDSDEEADDTSITVADESPGAFKQPRHKKALLLPTLKLRKKSVKNTSFEDNLNNDWDSVVIEPETKAKRSFKLASSTVIDKNTRPVRIVNSGTNNLDNEEATCIILESDTENESVVYENKDEESVIYEDDDESVVYEKQPEMDDDFSSVIFDKNDEEVKERATLIEARDPKKLFVKQEVDKLSDRSSDNTAANWEYKSVTKSEMGYIEHIRMMMSNAGDAESRPVGILDLSEKSVLVLSKMLSEFENLLDRDETVTTTLLPRKHKRAFAKKFGVIGHLKNQESGKVVDYTLAKSIIDRTLISRQLVRNITLINTFAKLRREIGSGVPTRMGGMLPSLFFNGIVNKSAHKMLSIENLESFASSLLLIKVVVWSIFKAFTVSKPSVDPEGRHMLEEFGKAMIEKDTREAEQADYKKKSRVYTEEKKSQLGKYIITGAVYELIDVLVLLRPVFAITEALHATVASHNPQPSLAQYEARFQTEDKRVKKRLERKTKKVEKVIHATATLQRVKKKKKTMDKDCDVASVSTKRQNPIHDFLSKVEELHRSTKLRHEKRSKRGTQLAPKPKLTISPDVLRYRECCPERVMNVISDVSAEMESLMTILSIEDFFPTLLAFCNYKNVVKHYQRRARSVMETMPGWVKSLSAEFKVEILDHFAPSVVPEVEKDVRPKRNFIPRGMTQSSAEAGSELNQAFARLRKKKSSVLSKLGAPAQSRLKPEDESFFDPILNRLFSWKRLTPGGAKKIRQVIEKKLKDNQSKDRCEFVKHLQYLCATGCAKTISQRTLEVQERFGAGDL